LGFGIDYIFLALAPTYSLLFIGRIIAGITGASFTTGAAYIADVSTPETRAKNFGMIGAAFGLGFIIGPALGGLLAGWGVRAPFYAAAVLCMLNFLYGYFVLPPFEWKKANPFGSLQFIRKTPAIAGFAICYFLIYLAAQAVQGNWSYFTIYRFGWKENMVGLSLGAVGLLVGLVQTVVTRKINPVLGNEKSIYIGLILYSLGLVLFGIATETWMMFAFLIPYCFGGNYGHSCCPQPTRCIARCINQPAEPHHYHWPFHHDTSLQIFYYLQGPFYFARSFFFSRRFVYADGSCSNNVYI
jgi:DHA1 family tetracycline resistance protein-like MFS transporter